MNTFWIAYFIINACVLLGALIAHVTENRPIKVTLENYSVDGFKIDTLEDGGILIWDPKAKPIPDYTTPVEAGYICKHCGGSLYRQHQGTWVHATFENGGYISCQDHKNKKFDRDRQGETTYAEPAERL